MDSVNKKLQQALELGEQGKLEQAIEILHSIKRPRDAYAFAQGYLGELLYQQNKLEEAKQVWQNIKRENLPEVYAKAQVGLGVIFHQQGKLEDAKQTWQNIKREDSPEAYAKAQVNLGVLFQEQGKLTDAEETWQNIKRGDSPEVYTNAQGNLGALFHQQGKLEKAKQAWQNIKREDSPEEYAKTQFNLGVLFHRQGKLEEAKQVWQNIKRVDSPTVYAKAQFNLGVPFHQQGKLEEAKQVWQNIKREDSPEEYARTQINLGMIFRQQDKLEEAKQTWQNIKREDSPEEYAKAQFNLGYTAYDQGQIQDAEQLFFKNIEFHQFTKTDWIDITQRFFIDAIPDLIGEGHSNIAKDFLNHIVLPEYLFTRKALQYILDSNSSDVLMEIFKSVHKILQNLALGQDKHQYERQFAHYTRPSTAHLLLTGKSPFRLNTIANVNDPTEGEILNHYLNNMLPESSKQAVFISCFTFNHDSLNQFRLYGKEDGKEASGCSIVLDKGFFNPDTMAIGTAMGTTISSANSFKGFVDTESKKSDKPKTKEEKVIGLLPLYRCIYIDKQNPQYIRLACRDEVTFYREFHKENNAEIIQQEWQKYQAEIQAKQQTVIAELKKISNSIQELNQNQDAELAEALNYILLPLKYLVKHAAFQEEQECRMFYITDWDDEYIQTDFNNHWLYVNYAAQPLEHLRKIYLSPGAMQHQHFFDILVFNKNKNIKKPDEHAKVCHSSNPFRNP